MTPLVQPINQKLYRKIKKMLKKKKKRNECTFELYAICNFVRMARIKKSL